MEAARGLTDTDRGRLTQARLRRAISTAYYGMFHCLAASAANLLIGRMQGPAWHRAYRALEHGRARSACLQNRTMREFPAEVRHFAKAFVTLQDNRQQADYALDAGPYRKSDVIGQIDMAELAIARFERADIEARRGFVAHVLFRQRPP